MHKDDVMQTENQNHQPKLARVIALINPYSLFINTTTSTPSMIIDPMFPYRKACLSDIAITIFGRQSGITCKISV